MIKIHLHALYGILYKELLRFVKQKGRFFSSLVRPLLWLLIFAVGFRSVLGIAIIPPYETYITYDVYIMPGLIAMILLFNGMQSSLSIIFDREMGSMKVLLSSYINRNFLLFAKMLSTAIVSLIQAIVFLVICYFYGIYFPLLGFFAVFVAIVISSIIINALAIFISSTIKQLENFAAVMNFIIFPMFFLSPALYPLWKLQESSLWLYYLSLANPFTHIVDFIRYSVYAKMYVDNVLIVLVLLVGSLVLAFVSYSPKNVFGSGRG